MRSLLAILLLLSSVMGGGLRAQDLTGQWTGTATDNGSETRQKIVLTITEGDSAVAGVLHWYSPETQYIRHIIISGRFYGRDSVLTIREDSAVTRGTDEAGRGTTGDSNRGLGFHVLYYRRTPGRRDVLEGYWESATGLQGEKAALAIRLEKKAPPFIPVFIPPRKKKDSVQLKALHDRE